MIILLIYFKRIHFRQGITMPELHHFCRLKARRMCLFTNQENQGLGDIKGIKFVDLPTLFFPRRKSPLKNIGLQYFNKKYN
jgi:hypothetical protein